MSKMTTSLPSPRTFLTSLVNTLASSSSSTSSSNFCDVGRSGGEDRSSSTSNPLKRLAGPHRALLTTLHVLYPSVLLPALDVLDRRLVTRVFVVEGEPTSASASNSALASSARKQGGLGGTGKTGGDTGSGSEVNSLENEQPPPHISPPAAASSLNARVEQAAVESSSEEGHGNQQQPPPSREQEQQQEKQWEERPTFHIVRSAQQPQSLRRNHHHGNAGTTASPRQTYIVRLRPWSCTCAAFAFAAYPFEGSSSFGSGSGPSSHGYCIEPPFSSLSQSQSRSRSRPESGRHTTGIAAATAAGEEKTGIEWEFGGLSIDGKVRVQGGNGAIGIAAGVPACKHLLACVLAERLGAGEIGLGAYVEERRVGREEGAGLVGDV